eukprot:CAMPEP_0184674280 /NCGR_PEP_ID=MMETSP0308-20130426/87152_1 /TAXON_ID=38269 /ORGANISM="Gloeochaete witrockiana, Strain SAG 46.84" /LENGTH=319 /DNA_ID=CAMNT_0027121867 /DNA_START=199 /DNA_END=1155 /DNA_ORIENTATION=+
MGSTCAKGGNDDDCCFLCKRDSVTLSGVELFHPVGPSTALTKDAFDLIAPTPVILPDGWCDATTVTPFGVLDFRSFSPASEDLSSTLSIDRVSPTAPAGGRSRVRRGSNKHMGQFSLSSSRCSNDERSLRSPSASEQHSVLRFDEEHVGGLYSGPSGPISSEGSSSRMLRLNEDHSVSQSLKISKIASTSTTATAKPDSESDDSAAVSLDFIDCMLRPFAPPPPRSPCISKNPSPIPQFPRPPPCLIVVTFSPQQQEEKTPTPTTSIIEIEHPPQPQRHNNKKWHKGGHTRVPSRTEPMVMFFGSPEDKSGAGLKDHDW